MHEDRSGIVSWACKGCVIAFGNFALFPIVTSRFIDSEGIYPFLALDRDT